MKKLLIFLILSFGSLLMGELWAAERRANRAVLLESGIPVIDVTLPIVDDSSVGGLIMLFEAACATAGWLRGVSPAVWSRTEGGGQMARGLLGQSGFETEASRVLAREAGSAKD